MSSSDELEFWFIHEFNRWMNSMYQGLLNKSWQLSAFGCDWHFWVMINFNEEFHR